MLNAKVVNGLKDDVPMHKTNFKRINNEKMYLPAWQPILAMRVTKLLENFNCDFVGPHDAKFRMSFLGL